MSSLPEILHSPESALVVDRAHSPEHLREAISVSAKGDGQQIEIQLGHMCNNVCSCCVSGQLTQQRIAKRIDLEPIIGVLEEARARGVQRVTFLGGEPTIQPSFLPALTKAVELGFPDIILFTNLVPYASDQTVVQRYLTTRDERAAARSLWLNLAITVPTGLLFFGLGTALWAFYAGHPAEAALLPAKDDQLVPWFVVTQLPAGVAGIVIAGIFAAAMSSLDSSMNSITTAVVHDFVAPDGGRGGEDHMGLARGLTIALGVLGTGAAILLASVDIKYLFDAFQRIIGLFGGGVSGVFLLAVFARGANANGALAGLFAGGAATAFAATASPAEASPLISTAWTAANNECRRSAAAAHERRSATSSWCEWCEMACSSAAPVGQHPPKQHVVSAKSAAS